MQFLKGLVSKFKDDNKSASVQIVADRFKQLFTDHGVGLSQIPRIFPKVSLEDLKSDDALLKRLNPELLDDAANFFPVRVEWLEGEDDRIYPCISNYKQPQQFFDLFNSIKYEKFNYPVRLVTSAEKLDFRADGYQPILIMLAEKIAEIGEKNIYRYYIDTEWSWNHSPCRLQLKAIGYQIYKKLGAPIPIFKIKHDVFETIAAGECIPTNFVNKIFATDPSLEDFVLYPHESQVSKEYEDIHSVINYIKKHKLDNCFESEKQYVPDPQAEECFSETLSKPVLEDVTSESTNQTLEAAPVSLQQKASRARHEPVNQLKRDCVKYWLNNTKLSNNETARRFYQSLTPECKKLLSASNAEITLSNAISQFKRKDELLGKAKLPYWLIDFDR